MSREKYRERVVRRLLIDQNQIHKQATKRHNIKPKPVVIYGEGGDEMSDSGSVESKWQRKIKVRNRIQKYQ